MLPLSAQPGIYICILTLVRNASLIEARIRRQRAWVSRRPSRVARSASSRVSQSTVFDMTDGPRERARVCEARVSIWKPRGKKARVDSSRSSCGGHHRTQ